VEPLFVNGIVRMYGPIYQIFSFNQVLKRVYYSINTFINQYIHV